MGIVKYYTVGSLTTPPVTVERSLVLEILPINLVNQNIVNQAVKADWR